MRRSLTYGIWFGKREAFHVVRRMELKQAEGENVRETYLIEGLAYNAPYSPADVAELRAAIDEMERMHDQHRAALTDGAAQQRDPFGEGRLCGKLEERGEATEDGSALPPLDSEVFDFGALRALAKDDVLLHNTQNNTSWLRGGPSVSVCSFEAMQGRGLIVAEGPEYVRRRPVIVRAYRITDAGRAVLAAQTPEMESKEPVSESDTKLLRALAQGVTLLMSNHNLDYFRMRGWAEVTDATDGWPTSKREYGITDAGRRVLAEQEA